MRILVIDGQGGGLGKQLVGALRKADTGAELWAVGTNSLATQAMLKAGADRAATGENAAVVACRDADLIAGPIGIAIADSLMGEVTPAIALAVGQARAKKVLIPMNLCDNIVAGAPKKPTSYYVDSAIAILKGLAE